MPNEVYSENMPAGRLGIVVMDNCRELGKNVDAYITEWRNRRNSEIFTAPVANEYKRDTYIIGAECPRFGSGEAKGVLMDSVRGDDLYILSDVTNHSLTYNMSGFTNHMSPDDHFADIKRIIAACSGKASRITVIMPFLYESRQHKRAARESLDCAVALRELVQMGVSNILTFDAHDPRVQSAIPLNNFDTVMPTYQFIKALLKGIPDIRLDADHTMAISPDEGAMDRAVYFANVLGIDVGMFYKRRDYSVVVNGRNPIVAHEYLGRELDGKDVVIMDDMIASGESMLEVARELKKRNAGRIIAAATFGLFTNGLEKFDQAYEEGLLYRLVTTNLAYQPKEIWQKPYFLCADMSKYLALLIDRLNHNYSISDLLSPTERIQNILVKYGQREESKD